MKKYLIQIACLMTLATAHAGFLEEMGPGLPPELKGKTFRDFVRHPEGARRVLEKAGWWDPQFADTSFPTTKPAAAVEEPAQSNAAAKRKAKRERARADPMSFLETLYTSAYQGEDVMNSILEQTHSFHPSLSYKEAIARTLLPFLANQKERGYICVDIADTAIEPFLESPDALVWLGHLRTWTQDNSLPLLRNVSLQNLFPKARTVFQAAVDHPSAALYDDRGSYRDRGKDSRWTDTIVLSLVRYIPISHWTKVQDNFARLFPEAVQAKVSSSDLIRRLVPGFLENFLRNVSFPVTPTIKACFEKHVLLPTHLAFLFSRAKDSERGKIAGQVLALHPRILAQAPERCFEGKGIFGYYCSPDGGPFFFLDTLQHPLWNYLLTNLPSPDIRGEESPDQQAFRRLISFYTENYGRTHPKLFDALLRTETEVFQKAKLATLGAKLLHNFEPQEINGLTDQWRNPEIIAFLPTLFGPLPSMWRSDSFARSKSLTQFATCVAKPAFREMVRDFKGEFQKDFLRSLLIAMTNN